MNGDPDAGVDAGLEDGAEDVEEDAAGRGGRREMGGEVEEEGIGLLQYFVHN